MKDFCEGLDEGIFDLWEGKGRAQFGGHGRDTLISDAAGDDQAKPLEVGIDIEGEALHGDPAGEFDPHGGDLTGGFRSQTSVWPGMRSPQRPYHPIARIIISYRLHRVFQGEDSGEITFMNFLIRF